MKSKGCIKANCDRHKELSSAIIRNLASDQTRLAVWLIDETDLSPIDFQPIGSKSPFPDSNSELGGFGVLIDFNTINFEDLMSSLIKICSEALHIEIEFKGSVQLTSYDSFEHIFFGEAISLHILQALQESAVIDSYELFDT